MLWVLCLQEMRQENHRCGGIVSLKLEEALGFLIEKSFILGEGSDKFRKKPSTLSSMATWNTFLALYH